MDCNKCGKCCSELIIELTEVDLLREPRLREHAVLMDGNGRLEWENDLDREYSMPPGRCPAMFMLE